MTKNLLKFILLFVLSLSVSTTYAQVVDIQGVYNLKNLSALQSAKITIHSPEGLHVFQLNPISSEIDESGGSIQYYKGIQLKEGKARNISLLAAADISAEEFNLYFSGKRTGRPYHLNIDFTVNKPRARFVSASTKFGINCAESKINTLSEQTSNPHLNNNAEFPPKELTISLELDYSFLQKFSKKAAVDKKAVSRAIRRVKSNMNAVNGIYGTQLGIKIITKRVWADQKKSHPYKGSSVESILDQFRKYTNKSLNKHKDVDIFHLFTGKNFTGGVVGLAYVGSTCRSDFGNYSVSLTRYTNSSIMPLITSHEIGHNLGATHIEGPSSIMSAFLNSQKNQFISASYNQIASFINSYGICLADSV
jgi:Metallo-peptidase family M12